MGTGGWTSSTLYNWSRPVDNFGISGSPLKPTGGLFARLSVKKSERLQVVVGVGRIGFVVHLGVLGRGAPQLAVAAVDDEAFRGRGRAVARAARGHVSRDDLEQLRTVQRVRRVGLQ